MPYPAEFWPARFGKRTRDERKEGTSSVNNADLAETIANGHDLTKADARKIVDAVFAAIAKAAAGGDEIALNGFGKFKVKESAARQGRNPATGATIQIPDRKTTRLNSSH